MRYHGILDWRLGIALLRCFGSTAFTVGLDGNFSSPELADWPSRALERRNAFCDSFPALERRDFGSLPGFASPSGVECIIVHPLWSVSRRVGVVAEAAAATTGETVAYVDTFNLLKRQSWVYKQLQTLV